MHRLQGITKIAFMLIGIAQLVISGDDGEHYYPTLTQWFHPRVQQHQRFMTEDDRTVVGRGSTAGAIDIDIFRRNGPVTGAQPPFLFQGPPLKILPSCAEPPSNSYCSTDYQYPVDFITSCIENDPELFKQLRTQVLWSCDVFPEVSTTPYPAEHEEHTTGSPNLAAEEETVPTDPEPMQPMRAGGIRAPMRKSQPDRVRERLVKSPGPAKLSGPVRPAAARPRTKPAPIRRARDDTSSQHYLTLRAVNHTYEVCSSVAKHELSIVRAESESGDWGAVVQVGDCRQIVRSEECLRADEPCMYLCSHLKSQCKQHFALQRLLTCTADRGLHLDWFKIPTSCGCQVEFSSNDGQSTPSPQQAD